MSRMEITLGVGTRSWGLSLSLGAIRMAILTIVVAILGLHPPFFLFGLAAQGSPKDKS